MSETEAIKTIPLLDDDDDDDAWWWKRRMKAESKDEQGSWINQWTVTVHHALVLTKQSTLLWCTCTWAFNHIWSYFFINSNLSTQSLIMSSQLNCKLDLAFAIQPLFD